MKLKKKTAKLMAGLMAGALMVSTLAGCKGGKDGGEKVSSSGAVIFDNYKFEQFDFTSDIGEMDYIGQMSYLDGALYYSLYKAPDYPEEYDKDLEKLENSAGDMAKTYEETDGGDSSDSEGNDSDASADKADKKSEKGKDTAVDTNDISDDDLLGDMDDLFGEGDDSDKGDKVDKDDKNDNADKPQDSDSSDTMTYEEFEAKYAEYKPSNILIRYDLESKEKTELCRMEGDNINVSGLEIDKEGNIVLLIMDYKYDETTGQSDTKYLIEAYSQSGEQKNSIDITEKAGLNSEDMYVNKFKILDDGSYMLSVGEKSLIIISADGEKKTEITAEDYVDGIAVTSKGEIIISSYGNDSIYYAKVDIANGKIGDKIDGINEEGANASYTMFDGMNGVELLLKDNQSLYMYDAESAKKTEILKWMDCGLTGDSIQKVMPLEDGRIFCSYSDVDGNTVAGYLVESDASKNEGKQVIKVMSSYSDSDIQQKIIEYNKTSDKYKVELVTFENADDSQVAINNEITSGNIPDILDVGSIDYSNYVAKGILEDLTPYIQKDDTMNEAYFVEGLLDSLKLDGKQYFIPGNFSIVTLAGKESDLKKYKDGWTMKELIEYYNSKPEGTSVFAGDSRGQMLYSLVLHDMNAYIDWNSGEVKFDGEEFKDSLEFCMKFPDGEEVDYGKINMRDGYAKGTILLNTLYLSSYEDIQVNKAMFKNDLMFVGYPREKGVGTYISPVSSYGICSGSSNKEGAWEVLKYIMTPSKNDMNGIGAFPASSEEFEKMVKRNTATEPYTDEDGNKVEPNNSTYSYGDENGEYEVKISPAKDDEIQMIRDMIKNANGVYSYSSTTAEMVGEDVTAYFEGKKSLDETVKIIQDKMSKYVNENK